MRSTPKRITRLLVYLSLILTVGCTTFKPISLDILIPPDTLIYPELTSVTISMRNQLIRIEDSLFSEDPDSLVLDSAFRGELLTECTQGLGEIIETSPGVDSVETDTVFIQSYPIENPVQDENNNKKFVEQICSGSNSDILIILEGIYAWDTLVHTRVFDPYYEEDSGIEYINMGIGMAARWSAYETASCQLLEQYVYVDTVVWSLEAYQVFTNTAAFPESKDAFKEVFYWAGNGYGKRIVSTWKTVDRFYYCTKHKRMKQACEEISNGNLREAVILWKEVYNQEKQDKKDLAAKAAFNLAVACEQEDKLDIAQNWAINSYLLQKSQVTQDYIITLNSRIYVGKKFEF